LLRSAIERFSALAVGGRLAEVLLELVGCQLALGVAGEHCRDAQVRAQDKIARIIEPHVAQVLVVSPSDTGIRQARAKTDRLDARTLARLLAAGSLDEVWMPDRWTWVMRRRLSRRSQLVWARSRSKNQIHAVLMRQLVGRPPVSDLFGVNGREWLRGLELATEERETVDAHIRQIEFLERELAEVERLIAQAALESAEVKRLMSVPGVNVIVAASFLAAIGDIRRFKSPRKLIGYLGLDPLVRQSGAGPATHGHISKQGSVRARHALVARPGCGRRSELASSRFVHDLVAVLASVRP